MLVTLFGMVTLVSLQHIWNASIPILVTLFGMVTLVRDEQFSNAQSPILVTLSGIVTLVSFQQSQNASLPMLVTLFGIAYVPSLPPGHWMSNVTVLLNKTPSMLEYEPLAGSTVMLVSAEQ
jgi:hypothetical protein